MSPEPAIVDVEVDIFSGRPNPRWTLSDADAALFFDRLSALPTTAARARSANLGYRGLIVSMPQRVGGEAGRDMYIQHGILELRQGTSRSFFLDTQRALERWLIGTGKAGLSPEVLEAIDTDLRT